MFITAPAKIFMAELKLKQIKKIYGQDIVAVHEFNLEVADKEFIVLVGPSGCGKSTTLRMVAGLEDISGGELYIGENLVNDVHPKDRDIAMVFQNYALYPHMTVYENMAFALKLRKMNKEEIRKKVEEAAKILGITQYLQRKPKALSGGQRQRVAIGRAIVREPKVFLMDEPLSNLDAKLRNQMRAEIIKLRERINTTFLYVTHDQTEAMTLGDRIVVMKDGYVMQTGTPQDVFYRPKNMFVAGFIGSPMMNFHEARLERVGDDYVIQIQNSVIPASYDMQKVLKLNSEQAQNVMIGVRPEHIRILPKKEENCLVAKLEVSEMMGSEIHFHVNFEGKNMIIRVHTDEVPDGIGLKDSGDNEIYFTFANEMMKIFNPESGESLIDK